MLQQKEPVELQEPVDLKEIALNLVQISAKDGPGKTKYLMQLSVQNPRDEQEPANQTFEQDLLKL